jgi:hypothetical protein
MGGRASIDGRRGGPEIDFRKVTFSFLLFLSVCYGLSTFEVENPHAAQRFSEEQRPSGGNGGRRSKNSQG